MTANKYYVLYQGVPMSQNSNFVPGFSGRPASLNQGLIWESRDFKQLKKTHLGRSTENCGTWNPADMHYEILFFLDQRPYRCEFCDRSYKSRQSMKEHEYQCPFKEVSFISISHFIKYWFCIMHSLYSTQGYKTFQNSSLIGQKWIVYF